MSRRTPGRIAQLAVLAVLCAAAPAGCAGDDGGEPDARTDARDVVPDAPGGDVPTDPGTDATEPPLEWVEPHGEELPSGSVITPEAGGTIVGDDGRVMVSFPPGAVAVPTTVTLGPLSVTPPTDASDLGLAIDVDARDPDGQPVTELAGTRSPGSVTEFPSTRTRPALMSPFASEREAHLRTRSRARKARRYRFRKSARASRPMIASNAGSPPPSFGSQRQRESPQLTDDNRNR